MKIKHKMSVTIPNNTNQTGFTLIEVMLAVGIIATLSLTAISIMGSLVESKRRLTKNIEAHRALHVAMMRLTDDFRHAWMLPKIDDPSNYAVRSVKPAFVWREAPDLGYFMVNNFVSMSANTPQSNMAMIKYLVKEDPKDGTKKNLYRYVDTDFTETISNDSIGVQQQLLPDIKNLDVKFWNGVEFGLDKWDTNSSEFSRSVLPKMVKIKIESFVQEDDLDKQKSATSSSGTPTERVALSLETIVYILKSSGLQEIKEPNKEYRWQ